MKKVVLPLLMLGLATASLRAQDTMETTSADTSLGNEFDKWSIEIAGGVNRPFRTMSPGYTTEVVNLFNADLGVRYMFNNKFGLKLDFGYMRFQNDDNTPEFDSNYVRANLQGVANLGRIMNFEDWTNTIGLLAHAGAGAYRLTNEDAFEDSDYGLNAIAGLTGQVKLSNSIVLTGDVTGLFDVMQNRTFDGFSATSNTIDGLIFNASIGLTFYLGGAEQHADWVTDVKSDELQELENRIGQVETMMNDTDKDGVPDYLDAEPNSTAGVAVDTKGRAIDRNNNGVPDELESYIENKTSQTNNNGGGTDVADLINNGYVNVYFDFNQDQPNKESIGSINFLMKYLKENPSASADVVGYADEIGDTSYNQDLSRRRAENVKKILVDSGIAAGRLNIIGNGEDASVNKDSKYARQVVRRVTLKLK